MTYLSDIPHMEFSHAIGRRHFDQISHTPGCVRYGFVCKSPVLPGPVPAYTMSTKADVNAVSTKGVVPTPRPLQVLVDFDLSENRLTAPWNGCVRGGASLCGGVGCGVGVLGKENQGKHTHASDISVEIAWHLCSCESRKQGLRMCFLGGDGRCRIASFFLPESQHSIGLYTYIDTS